jgi:two-component system sensor kinase FixL
VTWSASEEKIGSQISREAQRLSPIASMEIWRQTVRSKSAPFTQSQEVQAATLRRTLVGLRQRERRRQAEAERRRAEREQARLHRELLQASRITSLSELGAAVAHELNQPLTATINFISAAHRLLSRRPDDSERTLSLLSDAAEQAKRAGAILRRVRDLIEHGETDQQALDLAAVVRAAVETAVDTALPPDEDRRVAIDFEIAPDPAMIVGDRVQLEQLIFNLVKNALEAMSESEQQALSVTVRDLADGVEVAIADSGPGLPPELADQLFKPFTTSKTYGMGIGLSLCRTIVESHGGRIAAENAERGAVFRFVLPRAPV